MARTKTSCLNKAEKRDLVKKYLEERRCVMTRELAEALLIDRTTLRKLLDELEREGAVKSRKVGRVVLWCIAAP